jgi:hypothetical protein
MSPRSDAGCESARVPEALIERRPIQADTKKAVGLLAYLVVDKRATRDTLAGLRRADAS